MTTPLWETDHPYYCETGNFYQNGLHESYETWEGYMEQWKRYDVDMNMIFRWDWYTPTEEDIAIGLDRNQTITIHRVLQRKAILRSETVKVTPEDEPAIRAYLQPFAENMRRMWTPLLD